MSSIRTRIDRTLDDSRGSRGESRVEGRESRLAQARLSARCSSLTKGSGRIYPEGATEARDRPKVQAPGSTPTLRQSQTITPAPWSNGHDARLRTGRMGVRLPPG